MAISIPLGNNEVFVLTVFNGFCGVLCLGLLEGEGFD